LVLIAPLLVEKDEVFKFCYCDPTTKELAKAAFCWLPSEVPLRDTINNVKTGLRSSDSQSKPHYLKQILFDVLWGWERYVAQVRADITGV